MVNENTPKQNSSLQSYKQRLEIIADAVSCLMAGSLFVIFVMTLPLHVLINLLLLVIGGLLILFAPILLIFTYNKSLVSKAVGLLKIGKPVLFTAALLSVANTMVKIIGLFGGDSCQSLAYAIWVVVFLFMLIGALIVLRTRQ